MAETFLKGQQAFSEDGWQRANETWTYASASTITVPSGAASKYQKGDRLKFTQTTVKYAVVVSVADTVLTIAVNTDYTVANAAITLNYFSHQANPLGYPTRFAYTSTVSGTTGSIGTFAESVYASYFSVVGNQCFLEVYKDISNKGSWTGNFQFALPISPNATPSYGHMTGHLVATTASTTFWTNIQILASTIDSPFDKNGSGYVGWADLTATFRLSSNGNYFF